MDAADCEHDPAALNTLVRSLMSEVARFITGGQSADGNWRIEFELRDGEITRVFSHHGPIGRDELGAPA
ncbi:MAG TPA: hypothetical protein VH063_18815 [Gaiellaceae bacterium]|jgi:hypothetical protein|nr:hypothetical protein [Gaiellaceae bacterium]